MVLGIYYRPLLYSIHKRHRAFRHFSCWMISATLISAGKVAQRALGTPGHPYMYSPVWDVLLDQLATHVELIMGIKTGSSLGCSGHALEKFTVLRDMGQVMDKVFRVKNFRKAELQLFNS